MWRAFAGLAAASLLLAVGCGDSGGGGGVPAASAELPRGASLVPAGAPAFVAFNTDFSSKQWKRDLALLRKFPATGAALKTLFGPGHGIDFQRDIKPAFGPEADIVWLDFRNNGNDVVGLTRPKDKAKLKALFAKGGGSPTYTTDFRGWTIFADSRRLLDRLKADVKGGKLADEGAFKDAVGRLDAHAAVRAYVSGEQVQKAIDRGLADQGAPPMLSEEVGQLVALAGDASAQAAGARFGGLVSVRSEVHPNAYTAKLPEEVPADALLYVSFNHLDLFLKKTLKLVAQQNPSFEQQLSQVEAVFDITLSHDVYPLLSQEGGLAVYPGKGTPTILLLLHVTDEARAKRVLGRVVTIARLAGSGVRTSSFVENGVKVDRLVFSRNGGAQVFAAVFGEKLVLVNDKKTIRTLISGAGAKLSDDPLFKHVQSDAKMPQRTLGFVYANLRRSFETTLQLLQRSGSPVTPADRANAKPLDAVLLYATRSGDRYGLTGFLAIK